VSSFDRRRLVGLFLVVVSACSFGSGALFAKPVYASGIDFLTLLPWRFGIGAGLAWLWLSVDAGRRASLRRLGAREVGLAVVLGLIYLGNSGTYFASIQTVPASLAALIVYIYPALVAVLSLRVGRALEGRRSWAALGLAIVGVMLAVGAIDPRTRPPLEGLALAVASPIIYAFWIVLSARFAGERSDRVGDEGDGAEPAAATALIMTSTAIAWVAIAVAAGRPLAPMSIPSGAWFGLIGVGVVSTFLAIQTFYAGTRRIGAAQASLVSTVEPIWTIALAAVLFGERLAPVHLLGGVLILTGVVLSQTTPAAMVRATRSRVRIADE
jgi:drug/metabolite transporter (DMT)-like permease